MFQFHSEHQCPKINNKLFSLSKYLDTKLMNQQNLSLFSFKFVLLINFNHNFFLLFSYYQITFHKNFIGVSAKKFIESKIYFQLFASLYFDN